MLSEHFLADFATQAARLFEVVGIGVVVAGAIYAVVLFALRLAGVVGLHRKDDDPVAGFRRTLGRSILLGLEFLVAADIIRTVAIDPTPESVLVLAAIVLIRTFLSFSLEVEIDGRWPWQKKTPGAGSQD